MPLTSRQARFVTEFLKDGNGTQAAIRAGLSKKTAKQAGSRMLTIPDVSAAIHAAQAQAADAAHVTRVDHLRELADIRDKAKAAQQFSAANATEANRGKVAGFYLERHANPDGSPLAVSVTRRIVKAP